MYAEYFGLKTQPFRVTPDTSRFYAGGERQPLLNAVLYAISHGDGIIKIVGEVGSGKTMLTRMLEKSLPSSVRVIYLPNPSLKADDLIYTIAHQLELSISHANSKSSALQAVQTKLLILHSENIRVVVFIDEAQCMPLESLEELRLLSNLETETEKLLQIVLFGQPELDEHLSHVSVRQIKERIIHNLYLKPLGYTEVAEYIAFRLHKADYNGPPLFTKQALKALARYSGGLPRRLSILADKSLLAAFAAQSSTVKLKHIRLAHEDSRVDSNLGKTISYYFGGLSFLALIGFVIWNYYSNAVDGGAMEHRQLKPLAKEIEAPTTLGLSLKSKLIIKPPPQPVLAEIGKEATGNEPIPEASAVKEQHNDVVDRGSNVAVALSYGLDNDQTPLLNDLVKKTVQRANGTAKSGYTIQIMTAYTNDTAKLEAFFQRLNNSKYKNKIYVHPFARGKHIAHTVTFGEVADYQSAVQLLQAMPDTLKRYKPFIRTLSSLREYPDLIINKRDS